MIPTIEKYVTVSGKNNSNEVKTEITYPHNKKIGSANTIEKATTCNNASKTVSMLYE